MYLPLRNYKYDSGPNRIQSGPDHEGYIVLTSGVQSAGADQGFIVDGSPLSGNAVEGSWGYDGNWRYVPSTLPPPSEIVFAAPVVFPAPYSSGSVLGAYTGFRAPTFVSAAGANLASSVGSDPSTIPFFSIVPPKYLYYGGNAPSNQDYSPFNTPGSNTAAEGKTGGGVTHGIYEGTALTNSLGSQGTSDRSQWRYHQPVYCKTYTETVRSKTPGLMSSPLRYTYRGNSTIYSLNYGTLLASNRGGFELLQEACPYPVGCPTNSSSPNQIIVGDTLSAVVYCEFVKIEWFRSDNSLVGNGLTYTTTSADAGYQLYFTVTYTDGSTDSSSVDCFPVVLESSLRYWYRNTYTDQASKVFACVIDPDASMYLACNTDNNNYVPIVSKISNEVQLIWSKAYPEDLSLSTRTDTLRRGRSIDLLNTGATFVDFITWQFNVSGAPYFYDYPVRIYRYRISKATGNIVEVISTDFNPINTGATPGSFTIEDVKIDSNNNYYMSALLPYGNTQYATCILKLNETLGFEWCKAILSTKYRNTVPATLCQTEQPFALGFLSVNDAGLIACFRGNSAAPERTVSNYVELDFDGNVINSFKTKFANTNFSSNTDPFSPCVVCRDTDGNIYGVGSFTDSGYTANNVIVYKDSPTDITLWAVNIGNMFEIPGRSLAAADNSYIVVINSKLVFVSLWSYTVSGTSRTSLVICLFDKETGDILSITDIRPPNNVSFGSRVLVQPLVEANKIIVQTQNNYILRLNVNDLPPAGSSYQTADQANPNFKYIASGVVPSASGVTFYRLTYCTPSFTNVNFGYAFTPSTPVATVSGATNGEFVYFAGQDIPI